MESLKAVFGLKPNPEVQLRKCNTLLRQQQRFLDRHVQDLSQSEKKARGQLKAAAKRGDKKSVRILAIELVRAKKQRERLYKSKAQLNSISMQLREQLATYKISGTLQKSTSVMKTVNSLISLPELSRTMQQLSMELTRAGVMDEMVGDMLDMDNELSEDDEDETEREINDIVEQITGSRLVSNNTTGVQPVSTSNRPSATRNSQDLSDNAQLENDIEDDENEAAVLAQMRQRLEALKS